VYGARPLKRVIQRTLQNKLAEEILAGRILDGQIVVVDAGPEGIVIKTRPGRLKVGEEDAKFSDVDPKDDTTTRLLPHRP